MNRLLCYTICLLATLLCQANVSVDSVTALQLIKDLQTDTLPKSYRVISVDSLEHDSLSCHIAIWPTDTWAQDGVEKWLVFVDRQPWNLMWAHPSTYYYVPKIASSYTTIPVLSFEGRFPPSYQPVIYESDISITMSNSPEIQAWDDYISDEMLLEYNYNEVYAVIVAGGSIPEDNHWGFYNDCVEVYNILTKKYGIPKNHIFVHLGSGGAGNDIVIGDANSYSMSMDLDGDGIRDVCGPSSTSSIYQTFCDLPSKGCGEGSHLFVMFDVHGERVGTKTGIRLWKSYFLTFADRIQEWLDSVPCKAQSIIIGSCHGGGLVNELNHPSRVISAAVQGDEVAYFGWSGDIPHYLRFHHIFIHKWANAIRGCDFYANPVNADLNGDKSVSMYEAFEYANGDSFELNFDDQSPPGNPVYSSPTSWLGQELSFDYIPGGPELYIRDDVNDTGLRYNSFADELWKSPDIWIRNQADGVINQTTEQPKLNANNKIYLYTRIHNRGHEDYAGNTRKLYVYWAPFAMGVDNIDLYSTNGLGGLVAQTTVPTINQDSSVIIETEWSLPSSLIQLAQRFNGLLPVSILVALSKSDSDYSSPLIHFANAFPHVEANNGMAMRKQVLINPDSGELVTNVGAQLVPVKQVKIPIYIKNSTDTTKTFDIVINGDGLDAEHSVFNRTDIGLSISPSLWSSWSLNGQMGLDISVDANENQRIKLLSDSCRLIGITLPPNQLDSLVLNMRKPAALHFTDQSNHQFNVTLFDSLDSLHEGVAVSVHIDGHSGGGDGPPLGPMFLNISNHPAASIVDIVLTEPAQANTTLLLTPTLGTASTEIVPMEEGITSTSVSTERLGNGPFVISLQQGGYIMDSRQLIH